MLSRDVQATVRIR
jgi:hypothetical protein